jgi:DME family drug/metabolite transporter
MAGMNTNPLRGVILVLLAASLWGTTGTAQGLADTSLPASWFGALRLLVAALFFVVLARLAPKQNEASTRSTQISADGLATWRACVGAGLCMAVYNLAFFAGIRTTGVALGTAVALGSGPLWAGMLQALLQRRWPATAWWLGTVLAVTGGVLMAGLFSEAPQVTDSRGLVLCSIAGLAYAVYTLVTKAVAECVPVATVTLRAFAVAATVALPLAGWNHGLPAGVDGKEIAAVLYLGIVATGIAYLLFGLALRHLSAASGVTLALFEPVVACLLAAGLLGEALGVPAWSGLTLVLLGVLIVVRGELNRPMRPAQTGALA